MLNDAPITRRSEEALANALGWHRPVQRPHIQRTAHAFFAQTDVPLSRRGDVLFAASSRLDNRAEIAATAGATGAVDEADCMRSAFEARGDAGIAQILGVFAFAHWNEPTLTLTLARDYIGRRSLFYYAGRDFVAFASHIGTLFALPEVPRELDERMLANFLALNHRERESTFYRGICRVPSRTVVRITRAGINQRSYWSPNCEASPPFSRDEDYIARARELFDRAVVRTLRDTPRAAIYLSGGLDSSAVAATAARLRTADAIQVYHRRRSTGLHDRAGISTNARRSRR